MTITTRQTSGVGVTAKNAPLTNPELDQNFIDLVNAQVRFNPSTISADVSVPSGNNAMSIGPLVIGENVSVTIGDAASWSIV